MYLDCDNSLLLPVKPNSNNLNQLQYILPSLSYSAVKSMFTLARSTAAEEMGPKACFSFSIATEQYTVDILWLPLNPPFWNALEVHLFIFLITQK